MGKEGRDDGEGRTWYYPTGETHPVATEKFRKVPCTLDGDPHGEGTEYGAM